MMRVRWTALLAAVGLTLAGCGGYSGGAEASAEGIQVHGDWTLEIYNEDGTLDERVEFSNDLTDAGALLLAEVLDTGDNDALTPMSPRIESWILAVGAQDTLDPGTAEIVEGVDPCGVFSLPNTIEPLMNNACWIGTNLTFPGGTSLDSEEFTISVEDAPGPVLRLAGSVTAKRASQIDFVATVAHANGQNLTSLTATAVGPFTDIEKGQIVQVTVDISFS